MRSTPLIAALLAGGAALALAHSAGAQAKMSDQTKIASAMKAAPASVARGATIVDMGANGQMRVLRRGTNNFTCMPDNPQTPGPDPMCADKDAMGWINAWVGHKPPPQSVGFMYMLAGGTDASNTDPYATKPTAQNNWVKTGPHVMIVGAPDILKSYPASPKPNTAAPYVMWAGTPYAHLMIPVT